MTCMCVCLQSMVILEVLEFSEVTWSQSQAPNTVELMHGEDWGGVYPSYGWVYGQVLLKRIILEKIYSD